MGDLSLNPYEGVDWADVGRHKAQFHAHTSHPPVEGHSGTDPPEVVIDDYREAGYSVLALTGHEYNVEEPTWPWTDWDRDPDQQRMLAVRAAELGGSEGGIDPDLLCYFADLADTEGMSVHEVLDAVGERGGLAVFPHPGRYHDDGALHIVGSAEIPAGGEATVTARWSLPDDETPRAVIVVGTRTDDAGERSTATRRVTVAVE